MASNDLRARSIFLDQEITAQCVCVGQNRLSRETAIETDGQRFCRHSVQLQIAAQLLTCWSGSHHRASCRARLSFPKITRESRRRDRRQRLVVEYAPKCQFDLVSLGHPLDPILDGRGPALRAIDHQPPEVSLAGSSGGAATNRLSVQAVHFFVVGRGHEMRERKGRSLNQHVIRLHCRSPGPRNHTLATRLTPRPPAPSR
jgi:hypothetical protein